MKVALPFWRRCALVGFAVGLVGRCAAAVLPAGAKSATKKEICGGLPPLLRLPARLLAARLAAAPPCLPFPPMLPLPAQLASI